MAEIMSKTLFTAFPEQALSEVNHFFDEVTGFPVVDKGYKVVGVISKKDRARAGPGVSFNLRISIFCSVRCRL